MGKTIDMAGRVFRKLTVIRLHSVRPNSGAHWECICACGKAVVAGGKDLRRGLTVSCGCFRSENNSTLRTTHGQSYGSTYKTWLNMVQRCQNESHPRFDCWGGRGIKVCERWHTFPNFLEDMGEKPSPDLSIERIDNDGNYEPGNCKWATMAEQSLNKRNTIRRAV